MPRPTRHPAAPGHTLPFWQPTADSHRLASQAWHLQPAWDAILHAALALGPVRLCAGDSLCRWEQRTPPHAGAGLASGGLQADTARWARGVARLDRLADGRVQRSIHFFDSAGQCALAVDLRIGASPDAFHRLVRRYALVAAPVPMPAAAWPDGPDHPQTPAHGTGPADAASPTPAWWQGAVDRLARPLARDAVLDVLQHASQSRLPMAACFQHHGLRIAWQGHLHPLAWRDSATLTSSDDLELRWSDTQPGLDAWLLSTPTATGLAQSLALAAPDGRVRLQLAPATPPLRPQPCAWRAALLAVCGGRDGTAC